MAQFQLYPRNSWNTAGAGGWTGLGATWSGGNVEMEPDRGRGLDTTRNELQAPFQPQTVPGLWELRPEEAPSAMEERLGMDNIPSASPRSDPVLQQEQNRLGL